jgi:hypothetical protein
LPHAERLQQLRLGVGEPPLRGSTPSISGVSAEPLVIGRERKLR